MEEYKYLSEPLDISGSTHLIMSGKGGVGKSFVARMLTEAVLYGLENGDIAHNIELCYGEKKPENPEHGELRFYDLDRVNHSFQSTLKGLASMADVYLTPVSNRLDDKKLGTHFFPSKNPLDTNIYDVGSNQFNQLLDFFALSKILRAYKEDNRKIIFHMPLCGSTMFRESLESAIIVMKLLKKDVNCCFWVNDFIPNSSTSTEPNIYDFFESEKKYWVEKFNNCSSFESLESNVISVNDLYDRIKAPNFSSFSLEEQHSVFFHMYMHSNSFSNIIVLANHLIDIYETVRGSIHEATSKFILFKEYIDDPQYERSHRYILEDFIFGEEHSLMKSIMNGLKNVFTDHE